MTVQRTRWMKAMPFGSINTEAGKRLALTAVAAWALGVAGPARGGDGAWKLNNSGLWSAAGNWLGNSIADGIGAKGSFTNNINGTRTITIDGTSRTLGILNIGDANNTSQFSFTGSGGGTLTFNNNGAGAQLNQTATSFNNAFASLLPLVLADSLSISNHAPTRTLTISGGITGVGNLTLATVGAGAITFNSLSVNTAGAIANAGAGSGVVTLGGGVGSSVTSVTENSGSSALVISTLPLTVNSAGTTLANDGPAGGQPLTVLSGITGTGDLVLMNNSGITNGITLSGTAVNPAGRIINDGTGPGSVQIVAVVGAAVTGVRQDSTTSMLTLSGNNTYAGGTVVEAGTLYAASPAGSATGPGAVTVNNGGVFWNSGMITGPVTVHAGGRLQGTGTLAGGVTNLSGGTLSAGGGASPVGTLTAASLAWHGGGVLHCEVRSIADGGAKPGIDYDLLTVSGALTALPGVTNLVIRMDSLEETLDFETNRNYALKVLTYGTASGFAPDDISLDTTEFLAGGTWSVTNLNHALYVICMGETSPKNYWTGSGNWSADANWSLGHAPRPGEDVAFDYRNVANCTVDIASNDLASLTVSAGYSGTITVGTRFPGWGTFTNLSITGSCTLNNGVLTHTANTGGSIEKDRLCMTVGGDFTLGLNAAIDASGKGFAASLGPGAGGNGIYSPGATHGGVGGSSSSASSSQNTYGSIICPTNHGSGAGGPGGGSALLRVGGNAEIDGSIRALGIAGTGNAANAGAAGGSVWLTAGTIGGSGTITASGMNGALGGGGGGGRIAVILTNGTSFGSLQFVCAGGGVARWAGAGTIYLQSANQGPGKGRLIVANAGTSILSDYSRTYTLMPLAGSLREGSVNLDDFSEIVISNKGVLAVNTDTVLSDFSAGRLIVSGAEASYLNIQSTNAVTFPANLVIDNYCLLLDTPVILPLNLTVGSTGSLSHSQNSSTAAWMIDITIPGDLTVQSGGSINADEKGYISPYRAGIRYNGASYGGRGHWVTAPSNSPTYGSVRAPDLPGSHGSYRGGGAVLLDVAGTTVMNGVISAKGQQMEDNESPGSGGAIWLRTGHLTGGGSLDAMGGGSRTSGGGGGRISVILRASDSFGSVAMKAYGGEDYFSTRNYGAAGTVYRQTQSQGEGNGELIVTSYAHAYTLDWDKLYTEIPAAEEASAAELANVTLRGLTNCTIGLSQDLRMHDLYLTRDDVKLYLNGHTLKLRVPYHDDWGNDSRVVYDGGQIIWQLPGTMILLR